MPVSLQKARALCTKDEFELVRQSRGPAARQLSEARLKQKVERSRRLRDKYRDLAKRQRLEVRGKKAPSGRRPAQGTRNTELKAELFQETLERFEALLSRVRAAGPEA